MDFGEIIGKAWKITWKFKGLWILGILAGCSAGGGGGGGGSPSTGANFSYEPGEIPWFDHQFAHSPFIRWLENIPPGVWITIAATFVLLAVGLAVIGWFLGAIGKSGLFAAFKQADETGSTTLKEAFSAALRSFWKILVIEIAVGIVSVIVIAVLLLPMVICFPLLCLLIPVGIVVNAAVMLLEIAVVVDDVSLTESPGHIYRLVRENFGNTVVTALILGAIERVVGVVLGLPVILVVLPAILGGAINAEQLLGAGLGLSALLLLVYIPVAIVLGGVLQTFIHGGWTLFYQRVRGKLPAAAGHGDAEVNKVSDMEVDTASEKSADRKSAKGSGKGKKSE